METRKRLAKIVLVLVGLFAVCWFPNHVLYLYRSFHYQQLDLSLAHLVVTLLARVLSFSSSCVNPFALYLLSETFRRHFDRCRPSARTLRPSVRTGSSLANRESRSVPYDLLQLRQEAKLVPLLLLLFLPLLLLLVCSQLCCGRGPRPQRQVSYLHSTSHIRLTSFKKATPTAAVIASAANGNSSRQEVAL